MNFDFQQTLKATMILFAVIDIIGSIPLIIKVKEQSGGHIPIIKTTLVSLGIMLAFLFVGEGILNLLGVDINSFAVAGSLILFALSLEMIMGIQLFKEQTHGSKTASIVPLAFPIIAGAGSMTSIVSLRAEYDIINIVIAIIVNMVLVFIVLKMTKKLERLLGKGGIAVLEKVFGIILLAIAVKLFTANINGLISSF
jgi:multiple antibiotic resistance protein